MGDGGYLSDAAIFEAPCGPKWMNIHHRFEMGAFSYGVSGYYNEVTIGRYCSFGENIQIGRGAHPVAWMSTSPFFYAYGGNLFDIGNEFEAAHEYHQFRPGPPGDIPVRNSRTVNDFLSMTNIGHDVWIGHGAFIAPGVSIGNGAVVAGCSVVTKDIPPYGIVGGNPSQILRMRFDISQCSALEKLAWWRFAPWQLKDIHFGNIDVAIEQLENLIPNLVPYSPTKLRIQNISMSA